jgi:DnaJ-class molecular chaperone
MLTLPKLFAGAFKAHHKFDTKQKTIDEMFELFTNKQALVEKLAEMYSEPMETLMDDDKRATYDRFGEDGLNNAGFNTQGPFANGFGDLEEVFNSFK